MSYPNAMPATIAVPGIPDLNPDGFVLERSFDDAVAVYVSRKGSLAGHTLAVEIAPLLENRVLGRGKWFIVKPCRDTQLNRAAAQPVDVGLADSSFAGMLEPSAVVEVDSLRKDSDKLAQAVQSVAWQFGCVCAMGRRQLAVERDRRLDQPAQVNESEIVR